MSALSQKKKKEVIAERIAKEFRELQADPVEEFELFQYPSKDYKWHFIFHGPKNTPFEKGVYHGDIMFKFSFPVNQPAIMFITENGRVPLGEYRYFCETLLWDASQPIRFILLNVVSTFAKGSPKPYGFISESSCIIRKSAEMSAFCGCHFCKKPNRANLLDQEYAELVKKWSEKENDTSEEGIGQWWHEERVIVINNAERQLEFAKKFKLCTMRWAAFFSSWLVLLNWKIIARHVLAPIIYRFFMIAFLIIALVMAVLFAGDKDLPYIITIPAIICAISIGFIITFEVGVIYAFFRSRVIKGTLRTIGVVIGIINIISVVAHLVCAIIISNEILSKDYRDYVRTQAAIFAAFSFGNDFYHYVMGILFYINTFFIWTCGSWIESLLTGHFCAERRKYKVKPESYKEATKNRCDKCNICANQFVVNEDVYVFGCDQTHIFHKDCAIELYNKTSKKCPMCERQFELELPKTEPESKANPETTSKYIVNP